MAIRHRIFGSGRVALLLFLIGLGTQTQIRIGGYIGISEIFLVLIGPYCFISNYKLFKRDGVLTVMYLGFLWCIGAFIANKLNNVDLLLGLKGVATPIAIACSIPCIYTLLRKSPYSMKNMLVGMALSTVISVFIFQPGTAHSAAVESGELSAMESVVSYKLFWVNQIRTWFGVPIQGWYMNLPLPLMVVICLFISGFSLFSGGRSAFLIMMITTGLVILGGRSYSKIRAISRHLLLLLVLCLTFAMCAKLAYKYAVTHGLLSESEVAKYERQTKGGNTSALGLIMSGRSEVFVSLFALMDRPIIGLGSWALDYNGVYEEFLQHYGDASDYEAYVKYQRRNPGFLMKIPCHSHIFTFWMWHGIFGLIFWIYILYLMTSVLMNRMHIIPEYYGYFAFMIPATYWNIFFSPLGQRPMMCLFISACLLTKVLEKERKTMIR